MKSNEVTESRELLAKARAICDKCENEGCECPDCGVFLGCEYCPVGKIKDAALKAMRSAFWPEYLKYLSSGPALFPEFDEDCSFPRPFNEWVQDELDQYR